MRTSAKWLLLVVSLFLLFSKSHSVFITTYYSFYLVGLYYIFGSRSDAAVSISKELPFHSQSSQHAGLARSVTEALSRAVPESAERSQVDQIARDYCHHSLLKTVNGEEAVLNSNTAGKYELVQVHGLFRHGDRHTGLTYLNYKPQVDLECGMIDREPIWEKLNDFKIKRTSTLTSLRTSTKLKLFKGYDKKSCKRSRLTYVGYKQLYALGTFISDSYAKILTNVPKHIYVQATDYKRTIRSAAAFMLGFIPEYETKLRLAIPIHVSPGTLLDIPPIHTLQAYPVCRSLVKVRKNELRLSGYLEQIQANKTIIDQIVKIAGLPGTIKASITDLYDPLWARLCHDKPMPCGPHHCIDDKLLLKGAKLAHWSYAHKHGNISSILAIQPFLYHSVISQMDAAVQGVLKSQSFRRFILSFGHDSTLSPLLTSLGFPQPYWLPYASRVIIELWRDSTKKVAAMSSFYVRILYNGDSLMNQMNFPSRHFVADHQLVKYTVWKNRLISGKYRDINSYLNVCNS